MENSYDFVILGGGTAGLVVANRLSEDTKHRVLVLEAGGDHSADPRVNIPALFEALKGSEADWAFHSQPQVRILCSVAMIIFLGVMVECSNC